MRTTQQERIEARVKAYQDHFFVSETAARNAVTVADWYWGDPRQAWAERYATAEAWVADTMKLGGISAAA
jgi:hypothetical protein